MAQLTSRKASAALLISILVVGCSAPAAPTVAPGSTPPSSASPPSAEPTPSFDTHAMQLPSRASLIQQAVEAGGLDEVTGLEYRAKAMFGLPGLPDEFAAGVPREDSAALAEIAAMIDTLSPADQARLRPYLLRPTQAGSPFSALTGAVASLAGAPPPPGVALSAPAGTCRTWADSGDLDQRFKVWACADTDAQSAEIDIATIVVMLQGIWDKMSNDMGGPPKPDAYGPNVPDEYGGDARIDFYALHMGQVIYREGRKEIPADAAAATSPAPPYTTDGTPRNASSAFMLMNIDTLEHDETSFELDLIHEFFHALEYAHAFRATHDGDTAHWFVEASAKWAETYYKRDVSYDPHAWFFAYQNNGLSLQSSDLDHQYASYVWPFFMEQEKGAQAIFDAWKQTDGIAAKDFNAVTAAVGAQLSFDTHFRDFAVRNLNLNAVLQPANEKRYDDLDANFYDDAPPIAIPGAPVTPGSPYVSPEQSIPDLAARYFEPEFSQDSRKVTISIAQLQPSGQVDGDFLAHYPDGSWKRLPIEGGVLQFCRDDEGWDIDRGYLVVSNHGVQGAVTGQVEIDAKEQCTGDVYLHGTFTGHTDDSLSTTDATFDVIVVWHRPNDIHDMLNFQFESGSYTFSTSVTGICGGTRAEGGPLAFWGDDKQGLIYGDPQDRTHEVHATLSDNRQEQGGLVFALTASFDIPSSNASCQPPYQSKGYVSVCALEFRLATQDTLQPDATCTEGGTTWTGHLVEQ
jgi:hypothetical protein